MEHAAQPLLEDIDVVVDQVGTVVVRLLNYAHHRQEPVDALQQQNMRVLLYVELNYSLAGVFLVFLRGVLDTFSWVYRKLMSMKISII